MNLIEKIDSYAEYENKIAHSYKNDREEYYNKLNKMVSSYGYPFADFSKYEYEDFFLKDIMHLGWKGWVYVDEAIDKHYHSNH